MNRPTPACRAASSRLSVAVGPLACDWSGSRTERGTLGIAASWKTASTPVDGAPADVEVGQVALDPLVPAPRWARFARWPVDEVVHHAHPAALAPAAPRPGASR